MGLAPGVGPGHQPRDPGRHALAQLDAMAAGSQGAILALGDVLGNVADAEHASAALARAAVVVVAGHGGPTLAHADVVLPAAVAHERSGTVTNLEGRVTALAAKVVAPGSAWGDVAIAAELAAELGADLGMAGVEDAARLLEERAAYPALSVLTSVNVEGVVAGRAAPAVARLPLDPMAFPGIRSIETSGLNPYAGAVAPPAPSAEGWRADAGLAAPDAPRVEVPHPDAYAWRVLATRRLYDDGVAMGGSPALAPLARATRLRLHHLDLDRLGVADGDEVVAVGPRGSARLAVERCDDVARGVVEVGFGTRAPDGADVVRSWLARGDAVADVRLETA